MRELEKPLNDDPKTIIRWMPEYLIPWSTQRLVLMSRLFPDWLTCKTTVHLNELNRPSDEYGYAPIVTTSVSDDDRRRGLEAIAKNRELPAAGLSAFDSAPPLPEIVTTLLAMCQREGIAVAFVWLPESPLLRERFPQFEAVAASFAAELTDRRGFVMFPAPNLPDEDYMDGVHLLPNAAERYSKWLAENHLRPWLAKLRGDR